VPISAVDVIPLAFQHTKRQLIQPFRFGQWTRLAVVGLLAGEAGSGGCNIPTNFNVPQHTPTSRHFLQSPDLSSLGIDPAMLAGLVAVLIVSALIFGIVLMFVSSVMRFILFDSVLARQCHIRAGWTRRQGIGFKYFLWQIGFTLATLAVMVIVVGIPAAIAFALGWLTKPREHLLGLILGGLLMFFVVLVLFLIIGVIHVLTKDFVVPQMALEGIGAIEGWRRLWPMIQLEKGGYAGYVGMKIVLAIGAAILVGIVSIILGLLVAIPTALVAIVAVLTGKTAGLTWNVFTITVAVVVGSILVAAFLYFMSLIAVPVMVFFPAYSIYFFASRYGPLGTVLYPPVSPPQFSPPLVPAPARP